MKWLKFTNKYFNEFLMPIRNLHNGQLHDNDGEDLRDKRVVRERKVFLVVFYYILVIVLLKRGDVFWIAMTISTIQACWCSWVSTWSCSFNCFCCKRSVEKIFYHRFTSKLRLRREQHQQSDGFCETTQFASIIHFIHDASWSIQDLGRHK